MGVLDAKITAKFQSVYSKVDPAIYMPHSVRADPEYSIFVKIMY